MNKVIFIVLLALNWAVAGHGQQLSIGMGLASQCIAFEPHNMALFDTRIRPKAGISYAIPLTFQNKHHMTFACVYSYMKNNYDLTLITPIGGNELVIYGFHEKSSNLRMQLGKSFKPAKSNWSVNPFVGFNIAVNHARYVASGNNLTDSYLGLTNYYVEASDTILLFTNYTPTSCLYLHAIAGLNINYQITKRWQMTASIIGSQGLMDMSSLNYLIKSATQSQAIYGELHGKGSNISFQLAVAYTLTEK
ncbi:hypothetical protein GC194_07270 [bacterium]|nr:hypothetical protein [bacterium]